MSTVTLVSGGLDSTLVATLTWEAGLQQFPLFIDFGQRGRVRELAASQLAMSRLGLELKVAELDGFGRLIRSGLTDEKLHIVDDAFTPGRNTLFLLLASAYAVQVGADSVAIGLLNESTSLFSDQTARFLRTVEDTIELAVGQRIKVLAPLADFYKRDVVELAGQKGIVDTYSCHQGGEVPCGECIACREFQYEGSPYGR